MLYVAYYEATSENYMKVEDAMDQSHAQLFRNITRIYCAEKLIRGEGHFPNLFKSEIVETCGSNNCNEKVHKLNLKNNTRR